MMKRLLLTGCLLCSTAANAFFVNIEAEPTNRTFSMTASGAIPDTWQKRVFELKIFSKYTGQRGAACLQPGNPLRSGDGFRFTSPKLNNIALLPQFESVIGCASPIQQQMLTLELMYETEGEIDFLSGSTQFHGLNTADTILKACETARVGFLAHDRYQDLVIWDLKRRPPKKPPQELPIPNTLVLMGIGLLLLGVRRKL